MTDRTSTHERSLLVLITINVAASMLHYTHYFIFYSTYPNGTAWLSPPRVDLAWFAISIIGVIGYVLFKRHRFTWSFLCLYLYGLLGLASLGHYALAPVAAHTFAANVLILSSAGAAAVLLIYVVWLQLHLHRDGDGVVFQ